MLLVHCLIIALLTGIWSSIINESTPGPRAKEVVFVFLPYTAAAHAVLHTLRTDGHSPTITTHQDAIVPTSKLSTDGRPSTKPH